MDLRLKSLTHKEYICTVKCDCMQNFLHLMLKQAAAPLVASFLDLIEWPRPPLSIMQDQNQLLIKRSDAFLRCTSGLGCKLNFLDPLITRVLSYSHLVPIASLGVL